MAFEERVREAFAGASLTEIADKTGYKYHTLRNYLKAHRDIPPDVLIKLSDLTKCSIHWLLTGVGTKYISASILPKGESPIYFGETEQEIIQNLAINEGRAFDEKVRELVLESLKARGLITDQVKGVDLLFFGREVPTLKPMRLWGEIAAGKPIDVFEEFETVLVPEEFFVPGRENFALRVRGDSMEDDGIFEGDIIICYETPVANNGDTVVALIDGSQATVKRFYKERGQIRLQPKSTKHQPIYLLPERLTIQGIVTGIFRRTI
jgi:repressor LexA